MELQSLIPVRGRTPVVAFLSTSLVGALISGLSKGMDLLHALLGPPLHSEKACLQGS